jgi:hypothetical protein
LGSQLYLCARQFDSPASCIESGTLHAEWRALFSDRFDIPDDKNTSDTAVAICSLTTLFATVTGADLGATHTGAKVFDPPLLDVAVISERVEMALSGHVCFEHIRNLHSLLPDQVKVVVHAHSKGG